MFIDVDVFKKLKFDIVIYHVKNENNYREINIKLLIAKNDIKFILFFSKYLTNVENRYWFTKLKIVDLIWFVRRIKYIIKISIKSFVIVYTNHFVIVFIIQQIKLSFFSIDKLNFRLIRVSTYLSQFSLNIKHKSNNQYVVSNVLSWLFIDAFKSTINSSILDDVYWQTTLQYVYIIEKIKYSKHVVNKIYVNMSSKFKTSIMKSYKQNKS